MSLYKCFHVIFFLQIGDVISNETSKSHVNKCKSMRTMLYRLFLDLKR